MPEGAPGNPGVLPVEPEEDFAGEPAEDEMVLLGRVRGMQVRLHRWAGEDSSRRFGDLFSLVCDPDFLAEAWMRARSNKGSRTPGIDGVTIAQVEYRAGGVSGFLAEIRDQLKAGTYRPQPVRQVMIPKKNGKMRKLGIATLADRVVQGALKLVLEPIFEADFQPCSYGFRPCRRAQDAIAEIHYLSSGTRKYHWVLEADIRACFDEIGHVPLMDRLRRRIKDKKVCALVKAFLKAGVMTHAGDREESLTGTPQGGILSPLLANIALSALDDYFTAQWEPDNDQRRKRDKKGLGNWRLIRYADDFVIMVSGTRRHAEALREEAAAVLAPLGLRLAEEKTRVIHIDEGFDFLGWTIRRMRKRGTSKHYVYTVPSRKSIQAIRDKVAVKTYRATQNQDYAALLQGIGKTLQGWANYFRHGVSKAVFSAVDYYAWNRIVRWLRRKHKGRTGLGMPALRRRFCLPGTWILAANGVRLTGAASVKVKRYRYRGAKIPTPWTPRPATAAPGG
jgi:RNA-directed DNA polymerase